MASDKSVDELAEYRRDPPPPYQSDDELFKKWMLRHRDYFTSFERLQLHQLPSMSPLWGYDESYFQNRIFDKLVRVTRAAGRRLTPDEMALYLDHASKETVVQSYDRPAAIATTIFLISRGWRNYTFPFYRPTSARFNPLFFPSPSRPLFRGSLAAASWQGVRCSLYIGFGLLAYKLLAPVYRFFADSSLAFLEREPGLTNLNNDVQKGLVEASRHQE